MFSQEKIDIVTEKIVAVDRLSNNFTIKTTKDLYSVDYIVLIAGFIPKKLLGLEAEKVLKITPEEILNSEKLRQSVSEIINAASLPNKW